MEGPIPSIASQWPPATFQVQFFVRNLADGSNGNFTVDVHPEWAPSGAARFAELVRGHVFDRCRFFRVIKGFMAQWGIPAEPRVAAKWATRTILDDRVRVQNTRGRLSYAAAGPDTRTTQIFVNLVDNVRLDDSGFAPFAEVVEGMSTVDLLYDGYGEGPPGGSGPRQGRIQAEGAAYLERDFPLLSFIDSVQFVNTSQREVDLLLKAAKDATLPQQGQLSVLLVVLVLVAAAGAALIAWTVGACDVKYRPANYSPVAQQEGLEEEIEGVEMKPQLAPHMVGRPQRH